MRHLIIPVAGVVLAAGVLPAQARPATDTTRTATAQARPGRDTTRAPARKDYSAPLGAGYIAHEVTIPTPMGHTLAGTLTLPTGASATNKVAAVVTITGSGPQDRDESLPTPLGYRPFRQFADSLGRRGIAVLRMDDRGTGSSTGDHRTATSSDFAEDIRAGLAYLRTRPEIDASRLGVLGHSEGGLIGPMVAVKEPQLRAMVLLAAPSWTGRKILDFQMNNMLRGDTSLKGTRLDSARARIPHRIDSLAATNPWMKFFFDHDVLAVARQVKAPTLLLFGATDQQVTQDQAAELAAAIKSGGNTDVTFRIFPDLNHLFIYDPVGFPGGYARLTRSSVEPYVIGTAVDWLVQRLK
ncbi:MAG TPA: alpha/beta fold hydrolase [Gemmatimonadaceae bacterium]|nr:alpha/beta fold hydrolase [Gemmatimonadaceae bacterium]